MLSCLMMKKTTIYILSILVIVVLGFSILLPSGQILSVGAESFSEGFKDGIAGDEPIIGSPLQLQFVPTMNTMLQPKDSIQFSDHELLPIVIDSATVLLPDDRIPEWSNWALIIIAPLQIVLLCFVVWKFLKFILNVSKHRIFEAINVKYLRQTSLFLLGIVLLQVAAGVVQEIIFAQQSFALKGYDIAAYWTFPWSNLLLGTFGLLLAQVWSYGLQMKEDQELTI